MSQEEETYGRLIETWLAANGGVSSEAELARLSHAIVTDSAFRIDLLQIIEQHLWLERQGAREPRAPSGLPPSSRLR